MSQKNMNTHEMDAVTYYTKEDNAVVAEKFQISDMWKKDDWLSIWIGFVIIAVGWLSIVQGFSFKSTKVGTWGGSGKSLGEVLTMDMWLGVLFTFAVFAILFAFSYCFAPNERESIAFIPTDVPPQTAIISCCNGNARETALSAPSPN